MSINFESKGDFDKVEAWVKKVSSLNPSDALSKAASDGTGKLKEATPKDTGETSKAWRHVVTTSGTTTEVNWYNDAHPETEVNLVRLIETGHGTRNGGYVQPNPFIKNTMKEVYDSLGKIIEKEMK